jgi:stage IV sporulation protein FB
MFLLEPGHTGFDLHFSVFGIPVRVHPMFWLVSAIMGFSFLHVSIALFLIWVGCVFFSILVHELGHVLMFRTFGVNAHVVLYAFGGLAIPTHGLYNRWKRIAVSFAGPLAQFLLLAVMAVAFAMTGLDRLQWFLHILLGTLGIRTETFVEIDLHPLLMEAIFFLAWINLIWALINLLPVYPLDGGQISRDFLDGVMPRGQGVRTSLGISMVVAGIFCVNSIAAAHGEPLIPFLPAGGNYTAIMFGLLALESFQLLQQQSNSPWRREG